jgi:hypothetical protein
MRASDVVMSSIQIHKVSSSGSTYRASIPGPTRRGTLSKIRTAALQIKGGTCSLIGGTSHGISGSCAALTIFQSDLGGPPMKKNRKWAPHLDLGEKMISHL